MSHLAPSTSFQSTERTSQGAISGDSKLQSPRTASIHVLDDDSLLHIFYLYRPSLFGENGDEDAHIWGGCEGWVHAQWWYKPAHVCQRWRKVILGSASYLELSLVCTYGTRVADMLAHSPPLPLVIDYRSRGINTEDEEGMILALKQRGRVCRVRLVLSITSLQNVIVAIEEEYLILEYLSIEPRDENNGMIFRFSETLQAPHLRHLVLKGFVLPIGSQLLTTATVSLVTLYLYMDHPSTYFHPNTLLQWLSFMPQLETLLILFSFPVLNHDLARQLTHTPIITLVTLPNLCRFTFRGVSTYSEVLIHRITAPRLEKLEIIFFHQLTLSVPRLLQFINTTENLRFDSAQFNFSDEAGAVGFFLGEKSEVYAIIIAVECKHLDWQVSSMAEISDSPCQMFSSVEHAILRWNVHSRSSEEHNEVGRTRWRKLLSSFRNVKTLRIDAGLVKDLSRCLQLENGELPLELVPELQELTFSRSDNTDDAFTSFIDARRNVGRPVTLVRP